MSSHLLSTGTKPASFDAVYHWWNDFDLAFLGKEINKRIRQKLWRMEKLLNKTTGALWPYGRTCLPEYPKDRELVHFDATLTEPVIVEGGF
jgi:hypothetical protein